jgi:hypothetical protein
MNGHQDGEHTHDETGAVGPAGAQGEQGEQGEAAVSAWDRFTARMRGALDFDVNVRSLLTFALVAALTLSLLYFVSAKSRENQEALEKVALETHTALCTFTDDLTRRYESTREYLQKHPGREPIPGITRASLRRSLESQRATLDSLAVLEC